MFSREGFTVDVVGRFMRQTILNPVIPISAAIVGIVAYSRPYLSADVASPQLPALNSPWIITTSLWSLLSILVWVTDYLNDRYANNWINDISWDWTKEIVLITGGSSGIGASIAQHLLKNNPKTTIIILDYSPLSWAPAPGSRVYYYKCDLSQSPVIKNICDKVRREVGTPTVLVNNAGLSRGFTVMEGTYADVEVTVRTNLIAPFLLIKEFLPYMVQQNHGHILNISSMSSIIPPAGIADYAATKAGLNALHEALQLEVKNIHHAPKVRLSLGIFSFIRTPLFKGETGMGNFLYPVLHVDTVGETLADILLRGRGKTVYMPGMMRYLHSLRVLPEWMMRIMRESSQHMRVDFQGRQKVDPKTGGLLD